MIPNNLLPSNIMTTTTPAPFPENGLRGLTPKETMQRAKALACTLPNADLPEKYKDAA